MISSHWITSESRMLFSMSVIITSDFNKQLHGWHPTTSNTIGSCDIFLVSRSLQKFAIWTTHVHSQQLDHNAINSAGLGEQAGTGPVLLRDTASGFPIRACDTAAPRDTVSPPAAPHRDGWRVYVSLTRFERFSQGWRHQMLSTFLPFSLSCPPQDLHRCDRCWESGCTVPLCSHVR